MLEWLADHGQEINGVYGDWCSGRWFMAAYRETVIDGATISTNYLHISLSPEQTAYQTANCNI